MTALSAQRVYSVAELTKYGSPRTWRRIIQRGEIGTLRIGGAVKILESELERFLAARSTPARIAPRTDPQTVEQIIDQVLPRRRGRPKIGAAG